VASYSKNFVGRKEVYLLFEDTFNAFKSRYYLALRVFFSKLPFKYKSPVCLIKSCTQGFFVKMGVKTISPLSLEKQC
jgi:predicted N-acyltransferase